MKLTFNRSYTIEVKIQKPGASRAFVFDLEVAVARPGEPQVDPMSGMLLNLVDIDAIFSGLDNTFSSVDSFQALLDKSRDFVSAELKAKGCALSEICFREKRGFSFGWKAGALFMGHVETREMAGGLFRFESESVFVESGVESQSLKHTSSPEDFFTANPRVHRLLIENLGTGEMTLFEA